MKYLFTLFFAFCLSFFITAQQVESHFINFDFDSHQLTDKAQNDLLKISQVLNENNEFSIEIIGHTDQDGSQSYNQSLAEKRASKVYEYLSSTCSNATSISYSYQGERNLLFLDDDDWSKSKNRRVEIISTIIQIESIEDLLSYLSPSNEQNFEIFNGEESIITGREGSTIIIPKDAFVFEDGSSPEGLVSVEIIESFDYNSFASNSLSCNSGEEILESGGMMKITATADGRPLELKDGKTLDVEYPISAMKEDMELFYAEKQEQGASNWIVTESNVETNLVDEELNTELDMSFFTEHLVDRPTAPTMDWTRMAAKPKYPRKPVQPYQPKKPSIDKISLSLSKWDRLFMSSTKKEALKQEKLLKATADYEQDISRYYVLMEKYDKAIIDHKSNMQEIDLAIIEWKEAARERQREVYEYHIAMKQYKMMHNVWFAQNNLLNRKGNINDEKTFWAFHDLTYQKDAPRDIRSYFLKVFGRDYKTIFKDIYKSGTLKGLGKENLLNPNFINAKKIIKKVNILAFKLGGLNKEKLSAGALGRYAMIIGQLGWINCDRFVNNPIANRRQVSLVHEKSTRFYMIFHDMKSMLEANKNNKLHTFNNVPNNQKVTVIGLQVIDNQPFMFSTEIQTTENMKLAPVFKKSSLAEIGKVFSELNSKA